MVCGFREEGFIFIFLNGKYICPESRKPRPDQTRSAFD